MSRLQLVDETGLTIGTVDKLSAHENGGRLHRAVSVVLFDDAGRILIQKRSASKYHFAGKWANAACSHPFEGETLEQAGRRALAHELGISTAIQEVARFTYLAYDPLSGLTEHEYDHILVGSWNCAVLPNPDEVAEVRWVGATEATQWLSKHPSDFAHWFAEILTALSNVDDQDFPHGMKQFLHEHHKPM